MNAPGSSFVADVLAGLIVGILAVPQGEWLSILSFASVAGLPPVYGLYSSIFGCIPYFLLGTSPHLIVGPTAVMSLLVRASVPRVMSNGMNVEEASAEWIGFATTMSFLAGVLQVVMGLLGLGVFVQLVSEPIMQGFVTASALLMIISQSTTLLGIPKCNASDLLGEGHDYDECYLQEYIASIAKHADKIHWTTAGLSLLSLVFLIGIRYAFAKRRPAIISKLGPIYLVLITVPLFYFIATEYGTVEDEKGRIFDKEWHVRLVGHIPKGVPLPSSPFKGILNIRDVFSVFVSSLMIALIGFMEGMAIASTTSRTTKRGRIIPSRELLGLGVTNLICSVTKGYPITGSFSRTAANVESGATTQRSALVSGAMILLSLVAMSDILQYTPRFALAAIVVVSVLGLIRPRETLILYRTNMLDFFAFSLVVLITLFAGFERGLACGILISWVGTMLHRNPPQLEVLRFNQDEESASSLKFVDVPTSNAMVVDAAVLRLPYALVFSTATATENSFEHAYSVFRPQCIILDMAKCPVVDFSGIQILRQLGDFCYEYTQAKALFVTGLHGTARRVVERAIEADDSLQWVLAPIVGGIPDGTEPRVLFFETIDNALGFLSSRIIGKNPEDPSQALSDEAYALVEAARLSAWRQGGNVDDITPGWRIPSFARDVPFEVVVRTASRQNLD